MDGRFSCPDLRRLWSRLAHRRRIRAGIMNSGLPGFDPCPSHPFPRGRSNPAAFKGRSIDTTLPGGNSFPRFDTGLFSWGRFMGRGWSRWRFWGRLCCRSLRRRIWLCMRLLIWPPALGDSFPFQQSFHAAHGPPHSIGSGVLDPVAAVVAGLSLLGSLPELASQTLGSVIQTTANKFLRRGLDFFL